MLELPHEKAMRISIDLVDLQISFETTDISEEERV